MANEATSEKAATFHARKWLNATDHANFDSAMKKAHFRVRLGLVLALFCTCSFAASDQPTSPQAGTRTYGQNYKDMVLATCVANAYANEGNAAVDAGSSVSALRDWTYYDFDKSPDAIKTLVDSYLARDYHNPMAESEIKGIRFDFLKCLDLYHSKELNSLAKRVVINPKRTYRSDNPQPARPK